MALGKTIHFLYVIMRYLFEIRMAVLALDLCVNAHSKGAFVDKQQSKFTVFVNATQSGIFMAHQTVAHIGCEALCQCTKKKEPDSNQSTHEIRTASYVEHYNPIFQYYSKQTHSIFLELNYKVNTANDMPAINNGSQPMGQGFKSAVIKSRKVADSVVRRWDCAQPESNEHHCPWQFPPVSNINAICVKYRQQNTSI